MEPPCCEGAPCVAVASCAAFTLENGHVDPASACLRAFEGESHCVWRAGRCAPGSHSECTPALPSASTGRTPHVLLILTDQQSLWTISAYHQYFAASPTAHYASQDDWGDAGHAAGCSKSQKPARKVIAA